MPLEIHAGWKLGWIEGVAKDGAVKGLALKVAIAISSRVDDKGVARTASQEWIAKRYGTNGRMVRRCIGVLIERGHIEVAKASRGRGVATELRLIKQSTERKPGHLSADRPMETRTPECRNPDIGVPRAAPGCPPLPSSSPEYFPARAEARTQDPPPIGGPSNEREPSGMSWLDRCWWTIKERLARSKHFGKDKVEAWLSKLIVQSVDNGEVVLIAPTRFLANRNAADHADILLREWQTVEHSIKRVTIRHDAEPQSTSDAGKVVPLRERLKAKIAGGAA